MEMWKIELYELEKQRKEAMKTMDLSILNEINTKMYAIREQIKEENHRKAREQFENNFARSIEKRLEREREL